MEEILASIRRILNDDEAPATSAESAGAPSDDDVLVLDDTMLIAAPGHEPDTGDPEPTPDVVEGPAPRDTETSTPLQREPVAMPPEVGRPYQEMEALTSLTDNDSREQAAPKMELLGPEAAATAASLVGSLKRTLAANRAAQVYGGGPSLEDIVRAEVRPMLKEWLDANLAPIVERLVRAEIERVVNRELP